MAATPKTSDIGEVYRVPVRRNTVKEPSDLEEAVFSLSLLPTKRTLMWVLSANCASQQTLTVKYGQKH